MSSRPVNPTQEARKRGRLGEYFAPSHAQCWQWPPTDFPLIKIKPNRATMLPSEKIRMVSFHIRATQAVAMVEQLPLWCFEMEMKE